MAPSENITDGHEAIFTHRDRATGLDAFVAIHSTVLGPAIGGTRFWRYETSDAAMADALRLSRAMSYKCALAGLPSGGGKAVIRAATSGPKSPELLAAFGAFLNRIGDVFATGEDVGFSLADCERLKESTPFVAGTASAGNGDPCEHTALGVFHAICAVSARVWKDRSDLVGRRVAIQGLGGVGSRLARMLAAAGADLMVADIDERAVQRAVSELRATEATTETIHAADVDIWAPCALGGVIHPGNVDEIGARAVIGAANNQLTDASLADRLMRNGVVWAPDFLVSAGGIVGAAEEISRMPGRAPPPSAPIDQRLRAIGARTGRLLDEADRQGVSMLSVTQRAAEALLSANPWPVGCLPQ
jgi:leucine dehydrogenase